LQQSVLETGDWFVASRNVYTLIEANREVLQESLAKLRGDKMSPI
jgi:hypothetical protein